MPESGSRAVASIVAGVLVGAFALVATSCTASPSQNPSVELSAAGLGSGVTPTVTVSVTVPPTTVTSTATVSTTQTVTATVTANPTVTVTALPRPAVTSIRPFDQARTIADLGLVIADIRALDSSAQTGPIAAARFDGLSRHYGRLLASGAPSGLDPPSWYGRVTSLQLFADAATDEATAGSPQATARYAVIRAETGTLLAMANGAMRTSLTLPPPPSTTG